MLGRGARLGTGTGLMADPSGSAGGAGAGDDAEDIRANDVFPVYPPGKFASALADLSQPVPGPSDQDLVDLMLEPRAVFDSWGLAVSGRFIGVHRCMIVRADCPSQEDGCVDIREALPRGASLFAAESQSPEARRG